MTMTMTRFLVSGPERLRLTLALRRTEEERGVYLPVTPAKVGEVRLARPKRPNSDETVFFFFQELAGQSGEGVKKRRTGRAGGRVTGGGGGGGGRRNVWRTADGQAARQAGQGRAGQGSPFTGPIYADVASFANAQAPPSCFAFQRFEDASPL
ncbi:hypothetical protein E4U59_006158 [Claviceps monticola]|nr:hypothetical protein E4U59_006158 [Claviceps monticola]